MQKNTIFVLLVVSSLFAACGGGGDPVQCTDPDTGETVDCPAVTPTPTTEPTVTP